MKNFVLKILLFAIPVLAGLTALEIFARENIFAAKKEYFDQYKNDIEVLILGSSHLQYGIDGLKMQQNTLNLSMLASGPVVDYRVFNQFAPQLPALKYVLIDFSAAYVEKGTQENWSGHTYLNIHWDIEKDQMDLWDDFLSVSEFRQSFNDLIKHARGQKQNFYNAAGFDTLVDPKINIVRRFGFDEDSLATYKRYIEPMSRDHNYINASQRAQNLEFYQSMKQYCAQRNIKMILVSAPKMRLYNDFMQAPVLDSRQALADTLVDNKTVFFWNDDRLFENQITYFFDLNHLDIAGANAYTEIISQRIQQLQTTQQ